MTTSSILRHRTTVVGLLLILATLASWWIGTDHGWFSDGDGVTVASVAVLAVAFVKIHFVGADFMELRAAPLALRRAFLLWLVLTAAIVIGLFLRST